jgi:hypothetical protein
MQVHLISTHQIFKDKRASCAIINEHNFVFLDDTHKPILNATNPGDGSYVCTSTALVKAFGDTSNTTNAQFISIHDKSPDTRAYTFNETSASAPSNSLTLTEIVQGLTDPTFYPTKDRVRAKAAIELHAILGHPNDFVLFKALDNANLLWTNITAIDIKNASAILGACTACQQGKLRAPTAHTSTSQPSTTIGGNVHVDIYPIPTSIGGNNFILMSVDGRSDFIIAVPMPNKSTHELIKALDTITKTYISHGHIVLQFSSDDKKF